MVLGPNATSAQVTIKATIEASELTYNSGFESGPDGWYFSPGSYLTNAAWLASYLGRTGVVDIYGTIPGFSSDYAGMVQLVTVPNTTLSSLTLTVTYYIEYARSVVNLVVGLYDPSTSSWAWTSSSRAVSGSWTTEQFTIPVNSVVPGASYYVYAGVFIFNLNIFRSQLYHFYLDEVRLVAVPQYPSFTGTALLGNVTGRFEASLKLYSLTASPGSNVTLWLVNHTLYSSTPIRVVSGAATSSETSWIGVDVAPPGYAPLKLQVDASLPNGGSAHLELRLRYRRPGVTVTYPVTLDVVDPRHRPRRPAPRWSRLRVALLPSRIQLPVERLLEVLGLEG
ncbi:MAG: hypothetical protein DRJ57_02930 [Thermoprotei archaeon]|nr:MAG: hypothetical protein DRJ57_02930 [Thermoprotei archaeon]